MIEIKRIETFAELEKIQELETLVWNTPPVPVHQTFTVLQNGGIILGAFDDEQLVGFLYSFPGFKDGITYLCSHMLGISPHHRKTGIGGQLKLKQKEVAKSLGYHLIVWTYDPLESVNAYLNLHKLSGIAATYHENYYKDMDDSLNKGLPSDRFVVEWWINSDHVKSTNPVETTGELLIQTRLNNHHQPEITSLHLEKIGMSENSFLVPIPDNFQEIKSINLENALIWRLGTRKAFQALISQGYVGTDIFRKEEEKLSYYVFEKRNSLLIPQRMDK